VLWLLLGIVLDDATLKESLRQLIRSNVQLNIIFSCWKSIEKEKLTNYQWLLLLWMLLWMLLVVLLLLDKESLKQ